MGLFLFGGLLSLPLCLVLSGPAMKMALQKAKTCVQNDKIRMQN